MILCLNLACSNLYGGIRGGQSQTHAAVSHSFNVFFSHPGELSGAFFTTVTKKNLSANAEVTRLGSEGKTHSLEKVSLTFTEETLLCQYPSSTDNVA